MIRTIRFRPHHFLCTLGFEGKGYSPGFVENFTAIADHLRESSEGDQVTIEVVAETDSICGPCPNRRGPVCETEEKIARLDQAHAKSLGVSPGDTLTWGEAKERIRRHVTPEKFQDICSPCSWRSLGVCESALRALRAGSKLIAAGLFLLNTGNGFAQETPSAQTEAAAEEISDAPTDSSTAIPEISASPSASPSISATPSPAKLSWPTTPKSAAGLWKKSLPSKAPKGAKDLARAQESLEQKKYAAVRKLVRPYRANRTYADHAFYLEGRAALLEAKEKSSTAAETANRLATQAIQSFEKIRSEHLLSPWYSRSPLQIAQAELVRGVALEKLKKRTEAAPILERGFQRLLSENATYLTSVDALEAYARLCKAKPSDLCESWILRMASQFSKNSLENKTLAAHFRKIVDQAQPNFATSKVTQGYRQKDSDDLAYDEAYEHVLKKKWSGARAAFRKFLDEYPRSGHRHRVRYWLGRAIEEDDELSEARTHYDAVIKDSPLTVYGMLSQWRMGLDPLSRYSPASPTLQESDVFQSPQEVLRVGRVRDLIAAGSGELAAMDLKDIRPRNSASGAYLLQLAGLSTLSGAYLTSFGFLTELIQRADEIVYSAEVLDLVFPVVEERLVRKTSETLGLDPILILSLIKQESGFERQIHSSVGASGYMQLMPFTASDVEPDVKREALLEAETNIRIGSKYLKRMLNKYQGNVALALAAYNAGPGTVDRWVREGRADQGLLEFIERIPYKETRDYVGTIFRNYVYYSRKLENRTIQSVDAFWPAGWTGKK